MNHAVCGYFRLRLPLGNLEHVCAVAFAGERTRDCSCVRRIGGSGMIIVPKTIAVSGCVCAVRACSEPPPRTSANADFFFWFSRRIENAYNPDNKPRKEASDGG